MISAAKVFSGVMWAALVATLVVVLNFLFKKNR